ncbi:1-acylglycerol-3-phosphate O-acyltransferase [Physocladia obscura]|uniref:1-acylglycerol-3-phosphate O-acyltransferase n=1 Tax=Physocladia obscura TaxID=109957 RepID=A0AAD5XE18_9FUNG|nr:1-acylglycerol-3-phosphate O-acyltransferase [Physocladia obscura]
MPDTCVVLMKKEIGDIPFMGDFGRLSQDAVFIDRQKHKDAIGALNQAGQIIKERNASVFLYPEGTRTYQTTNDLLPFKKGVFHLAVGSHLPILPIVIESYHSISNFRNFVFRGGDIKVKILPPISTEGLTAADVTDLSGKCYESSKKQQQSK